MKLVSWNVNGLRAVLKKDFENYFYRTEADFFCIQETKMQQDQADICFEGYHAYWNSAIKKGYSGTLIFTKHKPVTVFYGMGNPEHDSEGRMITLEYPEFFLVNVYTPNSQRELTRLSYRIKWEDDLLQYLKQLDMKKNVILCGDLNVAHKEIDLKNPATNRNNAGFTDEERSKMTKLLESGFTDTFRHLYPDRIDSYTWWSYMFSAREKNIGWRIDYFIVSDRLCKQLKDCVLRQDVQGSDHCPVEMILEEFHN
jgi:exodeoxyribonuclease III